MRSHRLGSQVNPSFVSSLRRFASRDDEEDRIDATQSPSGKLPKVARGGT